MSFKEWPYWKRGFAIGLIAGIPLLLYFGLIFISTSFGCGFINGPGSWYCNGSLLLLVLLISYIMIIFLAGGGIGKILSTNWKLRVKLGIILVYLSGMVDIYLLFGIISNNITYNADYWIQNTLGEIFTMIIIASILFGLGYLIGFFYEKIKNRSSNQ